MYPVARSIQIACPALSIKGWARAVSGKPSRAPALSGGAAVFRPACHHTTFPVVIRQTARNQGHQHGAASIFLPLRRRQ